MGLLTLQQCDDGEKALLIDMLGKFLGTTTAPYITFKYYPDLNENFLTIAFTIKPFEEYLGVYKYSQSGLKLQQLLKTNFFDIVSDRYHNYEKIKASNPDSEASEQLFVIPDRDALDSDLKYTFHIRKIDETFVKSKFFQLSNPQSQLSVTPYNLTLTADGGYQIPNPRNFDSNHMPSTKEVVLLRAAESTKITNLNRSDGTWHISGPNRDEFNLQILNEEKFLAEHGEYCITKLNHLFIAAIKDDSSNTIAAKANQWVNQGLVIRIQNIEDYAVMAQLHAWGIIKVDVYPNSENKLWYIKSIDLVKLQSLDEEKFVKEFKERNKHVNELEKAMDGQVSWMTLGSWYVLAPNSLNYSFSDDQKTILKFITDLQNMSGHHDLEIYKDLIGGNPPLNLMKYKNVNPDHIEWLNKSKNYRGTVQVKFNNFIEAYNDKLKDGENKEPLLSCVLQIWCTNESNIFKLLKDLAKQNIISLDERKIGYLNQYNSIRITEVKDAEKFNSIITTLSTKLDTLDKNNTSAFWGEPTTSGTEFTCS